jgi:hypothetical protein
MKPPDPMRNGAPVSKTAVRVVKPVPKDSDDLGELVKALRLTRWPSAEKELVEQLRQAHPDLHLQGIYGLPEVASLYRSAWKDAPAEAKRMIDAHLECYWRKPANKTAERFALLSGFYEGGMAGLGGYLDRRRKEHLELREASEDAKRKREEEARRRIEEARRMTPHERAEKREAYRRRRTERAMRLLQEALALGQRPQHRGNCFFCARPLTDPVSRILGIGPDCQGRLIKTFGEATALPFLEQLEQAMAEEERK